VLRAGVEHAAPHRILAHGVHVVVGGNAVDDLRPGLAVVVGPEDVRRAIAEQHLLDRDVGGAVVERRAVDLADAAEVRHVGGVTLVQFLPPSRVTWMMPSSDPTRSG
jgi:hypothetical protein